MVGGAGATPAGHRRTGGVTLRAARLAVAGTVVAAALGLSGSGPGHAPPSGAATARRVERVLMVTLPGVSWQDVAGAEVPHLRTLVAGSAVASASLPVFHRATSAAEGYATLGAGALMNGHRRLAARARPAEGGGIISPAAPALRALNEQRRRGSEVGALGDALARAGVGRAVVGNADTAMTDPDEAGWHREAVLVLAGGDGRLPGGEVGRTLLAADPAAPFGVRFDPGAVQRAFRAAWTERAVVVVEASDVARAQLAGRAAPPARRQALVASALAATDVVLGRLLMEVDERSAAVIVVTPSTAEGQAHLGVAALRAPGVQPGLLRSASTRRSGLVTLADVAPTVLDLLGVPRPPAMEGRPFAAGRPGPVSLAGLVQADRESRLRDRLVVPVTRAFVVAEVALSVTGALALAGRRGRARSPVSFAALWLLAMLPLAWLPASFDIATVAAWYLLVVGGGLVVAVAVRLASDPLMRVSVLLGLLFALLVADVVTGAGFQLSAVFGYSPTVGGRYAGFGNLAFAQVAAAAALLAAIVAHLLGGRQGAWAGVGVLALAVVADGFPAWGADVGGVLAGLPGFAVVAAGLLGVHLTLAWALGLAGAAVAAVAAFGGLDLLRPPAQRTHLGRLLERMADGELRPLSDAIARKAEVAWDLARPAARRWLPLVPASLAFVAFVSIGPQAALRRLSSGMPQLRPAVTGVLVMAALGFALNDSGVAVPAMMLGVLTPVLVHLTLEAAAIQPPPGSAPEGGHGDHRQSGRGGAQ